MAATALWQRSHGCHACIPCLQSLLHSRHKRTNATNAPHSLQFPALYEEAALRLVHHSTEPAEQLASHVLSHFENSFVVGEELLGEVPGVAGRSAPCVVRAASGAAAPAPAGLAAAGGEAGGDAAADSSEAGGGAAAVKKEEPEESGAAGPEAQQQEQAAVYEVEWLAAPETDAAAGEGGPPPGERATLGREALARRQPSPLASLTPQLLRKWLETVAWAEPVTVGSACSPAGGLCTTLVVVPVLLLVLQAYRSS